MSEEPTETDPPIHQFQPGMGNHPLWQEFMDILKENREADIAEANRLADLEEMDRAQLKLPL